MAIHQALGTSFVTRSGYGDFPDNSGNWSLLVQIKYTNTPSVFGAGLTLFKTTSDFSNPYVWLGSSDNTLDIFVEAFNGTTTVDLDAVNVIVNTWHWVFITYTATTHDLSLYVDGVLIDSKTINLSSVVFDGLDLLSNSATNATANVSVSYCRAWSNILSASEMTAESVSMIAVKSTGLLWDCPLQTSIDLTSHNNTLNQLTATGTVTTDTNDPLLSIVAGPPTNISPATATVITPDSAYFQDVNTTGAATDVWHQFTAIEDYTYGFDYFGDLVTYKPQIFIYEGLANANSGTTYLDFGNAIQQNLPIQFPVTNGNTYFFKALRNGAVAASTLQVSLLRALDLDVPIGSIAVSDDITNYSSAFLDLTTGYPIFFQKLAVIGEGGSILTDGTLMISNSIANDKPIIFDSDLNVVAEVNLPVYDNVSSNGVDTFILGETAQTPAIMKLVSTTGVINPTDFNTGAFGINSLGLNNDSSKVYYTASTSNNLPIKVWNLLTNIADPDLVAGVANYKSIPEDILVLFNGDIIIARNKTTVTRDYLITNYSALGVSQHTYDFGTNPDANNRVFRAIDDPNSFWTWIKLQSGASRTGFSRFVNVKVSDGTLLHDLTNIIQYESGIYASATVTATPVRFGHAESCPGWIVRVGVNPINNAKSGLYILTGTGGDFGLPDNPILRHDVDWIDTSLGTSESVKIPDPYYDTYLAGDE